MALTKVRGGGVDNPLTLGGGAASDRSIIFDGNAQDFHIGLDDSSDSLTIGLGSTLGTTSHMVIDANGHVTKPLQSAFLALVATAQNNISQDTTTAFQFNAEIFDQNGDFDHSSNYRFTAPVTGKYQLNFKAYYTGVPSDAEYIYNQIITSNRNYIHIFDPRGFDAGVVNYWYANVSVLADMDANDTASVIVYQRLGSQTLDISGGTGADPGNCFSGYLVC